MTILITGANRGIGKAMLDAYMAKVKAADLAPRIDWSERE